MSAPGTTPAPWKVVDNRTLNGAYWICHPDDFTSHAEVRAGSGEAEDVGDMLANAHLIAASPAMYDALETICRELGADPEIDSQIWKDAFAALALARGEHGEQSA